MKKDRIMTRNINSVVGHFVAECDLDAKTTIIRDPRAKYQPVAFVPSVEKADILQAIRRVGQKAKLEQSFALLGIQAIAAEADINHEEAARFQKEHGKIGSGKPRTKVITALRAGGSLPEEDEAAAEEEEVEPEEMDVIRAREAKVTPKRKAAPPPAPKAEKKAAKRYKTPAKKLGAEHGW